MRLFIQDSSSSSGSKEDQDEQYRLLRAAHKTNIVLVKSRNISVSRGRKPEPIRTWYEFRGYMRMSLLRKYSSEQGPFDVKRSDREGLGSKVIKSVDYNFTHDLNCRH